MYRLFSILSQYRNTILFLVLELIAFYCIIRYNNTQRHIMGDALMNFSSSIHESRSGIKSYFNLRAQNEKLEAESTELQQRLAEAELEIQQYKSVLGLDSLESVNQLPSTEVASTKEEPPYTFIPSHVIRNTIHRNYNYLVLDKGSEDGVENDMGVVSLKGVAGRVIRVGKTLFSSLE